MNVIYAIRAQVIVVVGPIGHYYKLPNIATAGYLGVVNK